MEANQETLDADEHLTSAIWFMDGPTYTNMTFRLAHLDLQLERLGPIEMNSVDPYCAMFDAAHNQFKLGRRLYLLEQQRRIKIFFAKHDLGVEQHITKHPITRAEAMQPRAGSKRLSTFFSRRETNYRRSC